MAKYDHPEAFALMWYACNCGHRERIWNSRDGVTPFGGVSCISCGGSLTHVDFKLDEPRPDHELRLGQLFWRDGTAGDAITIIKNRIRIWQERRKPMPEEIAEQLLEDARNQTGEWGRRWPMLDRWDKAKLNNAKRKAANAA